MATDAPPSDAGLRDDSVGVDRRTIQQERRKHRRRWPTRLLIVFLALVLLAGLLVLGGYLYLGYRFHQIKKVHTPHLVAPAPPGQPFNVLLVGSDSRAFVSNPTQQNAFGDPNVQGGQRSDVIIVARLIPATGQVHLLSIPRDLWVDIPGNESGVSGMNRINTAFNSGPDLLIQTVEQDLDIPINHYVAVNFPGFQGMVDAIGGITMNFPDQVRDSYSGLDVTTTGCQVVNGATALELVRARHLAYLDSSGVWQYDGLSDFSRIQRQDAFFRAVTAKLNSDITNPFAINGFIGAAVKNLTIDDKLTEGDLVHIAASFHNLSAKNLTTQTLPTTAFVTDGGADVLNPAQPYANQLVTQFNTTGSSTTTTTAPSSVSPSSVTVQVLNGAGVAGIAAQTAGDLGALGFVISGTGDAANHNYATTQIEYGADGKAAAQYLAAQITGATQLVLDSSLSANNVTLIVGQSFTGVSGSGSSTTTTIPPPPADVITNTQPEPWNPTPCTQ